MRRKTENILSCGTHRRNIIRKLFSFDFCPGEPVCAEQRKEFAEHVREASEQNRRRHAGKGRHNISKEQKRHRELDELIKELYNIGDNAAGKMLDKHFARLLAEYNDARTGLEASIAEKQRKIESRNAGMLKTDPFTRLVKRYTDFSRLATLYSIRLSRRRLCMRAQSGGMISAGGYTFI